MKIPFSLFILLEIGLLSLFGSTPDSEIENLSSQPPCNYANIFSLHDFMGENHCISYTKHRNCMKLDLPMFPLAVSKTSSWADPIIPETFILSIPGGKVYSRNGIIVVNDCLIKELLWRWSFLRTSPLDIQKLPQFEYREGKVVVISQEGHSNYYHWMVEVIPKLAMLEEKNISYDRLYVSTHLPFMRQTLRLFGICPEKILEAQPDTYIEAQELIVPSAPSLSCYTPKWIIEYLRERLIPQANEISSQHLFSKRVFISRKKASYRRILNEDEVFSLFEKQGFMRYDLEDLTVLEQVRLFNNAEIIVAPHGAGLTNLVFAQPEVLIIELFQEHEDDSFWYLSQVMGLQHHCIKTAEFKKRGGYTDTFVPLSIIKDIIDQLISIVATEN